MEPVILAMYSGGLDSLGMIYKLLTDQQRVHIHHVHNRNAERRDQAEAETVKLALDELRRLGFDFVYSESEIAVPSYGKQFMYDTDSMNFFAGYVCSANPAITKIAMGMNAGDTNHSLEDRRRRADAILAAFTPVEKIYPVLNMSKVEIYASLPDSLKNKFWSCRTPLYKPTAIEPCGRCSTCMALRSQRIEHPRVNRIV